VVIAVFAWGFVLGYVVSLIKDVLAAKRDASRRIAEAHARVRGDS
jgi:hypothetical protein